jgi:hypothetical protein
MTTETTFVTMMSVEKNLDGSRKPYGQTEVR